MQEPDRGAFAALITDVHAFYRQDVSPFAISVWWTAMRPYDLAAVKDALGRHVVNPDSGQFMPKPADVIRMLQGSTADSALIAWSKVDRAMRMVGPYPSVVFDDPLIHRVLDDMGGWTQYTMVADTEWAFVQREFQTRYRGYKMRSATPQYPPRLIGIAEARNAEAGQPIAPPMLLGDADKAAAVLRGGVDTPSLTVQPATAFLPAPKAAA
jgi:hypothetical protein